MIKFLSGGNLSFRYFSPYLNHNGYFFILLFLFVSESRCTVKRKYGEWKNYTHKYELGNYFSSANLCDPQFGAHIVMMDSVQYISYLDTAANIVFQDINRNITNNFSIPFSNVISGLGYFSVRFQGSNLFLLDITNRRFQKYRFNKRYAELEYSFDLTKLFDNNFYFPQFQYNNCFEVDSPYLYLPYSVNDRVNNFLGPEVYLKIKFDETDSLCAIENKILSYPTKFRKSSERNSYPFFNRINDTSYFLGFESWDSVYLYNPRTNAIFGKNEFEIKNFFKKFDRSKSRDLAYVRRYDVTCERNRNILTNPNGSSLIIRHQGKKKILDKDIYEYYFLNKDLKVTGHQVFSHTLNTMFCFVYEKGFLIFSFDLTAAYYYEN